MSVYIHFDEGIANNRTFKTALVQEFGLAAKGMVTDGVAVTFASGEVRPFALTCEDFSKIFNEALKRQAVAVLTCDNWRNVYDALRTKNFDPVFNQKMNFICPQY